MFLSEIALWKAIFDFVVCNCSAHFASLHVMWNRVDSHCHCERAARAWQSTIRGDPIRLIASGDALAMTQCDVRLKSHLRCH